MSYLASKKITAPGDTFGAIINEDLPLATPSYVYETSGALYGLVAARRAYFLENPGEVAWTYDHLIEDAYNYLLSVQCVGPTRDQINYVEDNLHYGGWGYPRGLPEGTQFVNGWADMSNTQFALLALRAVDDGTSSLYSPVGATLPHLDWFSTSSDENALLFVNRSRNIQPNPYVPPAYPTPLYGDGGFNYKPYGSIDSGHHSEDRSYGSMTAAGIWSYWCLGIPWFTPGDHDGIDDARGWFDNYFSLDVNPVNPAYPPLDPNGKRYLYYYYLTSAKAFTMYGFTNINGYADWYDALQNKLLTTQNPAGYWTNDEHASEGRVYSTIFSLLALQTRANVWGGVLDIELLSPADLYVTDIKGRTVSKNIKEIPGATYSEDPHVKISIPSPGGAYLIKLIGTGVGDYTLKIKGTLNNTVYFNEEIIGTIGPGEEKELKAIVNNIEMPFAVEISTPPPTPTATITPTKTITRTGTPTLTPTPPVYVRLEIKSGDINTSTSSPHPQFRMYNDGDSDIDLSLLEIRYYYRCEGSGQAEESYLDYAGKMPSGENIGGSTYTEIVTGSFGDEQDRYLSVAFDSGAGSIGSDAYIKADTRFNKTDWSHYDQSNDWSFLAAADYTQRNKVVVYYNGILIWGTEPVSYTPTITETRTCTSTVTLTIISTVTETITPTKTVTLTLANTYTDTPTDTFTQTPTYSATPSSTPTCTPSFTTTKTVTQTTTPTYTPTVTKTIISSVTETMTPSVTTTITASITPSIPLTVTQTVTIVETPIPTFTPTQAFVAADLRAQYMSYDTSSSCNTLYVNIKIYNDDTADVDLSHVEAKYWYVFEGTSQTENIVVDDSRKLPSGTDIKSCTNTEIQQVSVGGQDRVLIVSFDSGAGILQPGDYAEVKVRIHKNDWSNYDQTNDYSFGTHSSCVDWDEVTLYDSGTKTWGYEPDEVGVASIKSTPTPITAAEISENNVYTYPNPCKDEATIRFSLAKQKGVSLIIYNIQGRIIWEEHLSPAEVRPGINRIKWKGYNENGMPTANGVYMLKIIAKDVIITKKIVLIR